MTFAEANEQIEVLASYYRGLTVRWNGRDSWRIEGCNALITQMRKTLKRCGPSSLVVQDPSFVNPDCEIIVRAL